CTGFATRVGPGGPRPRFTRAARAAGMPAAATSETTVLGAVAALRADVGPGDVVLLEGSAQQRFDRIALALDGGTVRCNVQACVAWTTCERCPMLGRTWNGPQFARPRRDGRGMRDEWIMSRSTDRLRSRGDRPIGAPTNTRRSCRSTTKNPGD